MQKELFREWLEKKGYESNVGSLVSRVMRIDQYYNVDEYYQKSAYEELIEFLTYSKNDEKEGLEPIAIIPIEGDYYDGLASLKSAAKKYYEFLNETKIIKALDISCDGPIFEGSFDDFKRYIGPNLRNLIQNFTRSEREKEKGICEYCHQPAVLQSAHKRGEDRPVIVFNILEQHFKIKDDWYRVPLNKFDDYFKKAHMPIRRHIFFICKKCHDKYDKAKTIRTEDIENERKNK